MTILKYFKNEKTFLRNILIALSVGTLVSFLNYIFNIYLARNFSSNYFGLYTAAIGIIYLVQIPSAAIQTAITKKVAQNREVNIKKFKIQSTIQLGIVALILSLLFLLFGEYIAAFANIPKQYILPLAIALFGAILSPIPKGFLLGLEKIGTVNIIMLLETVLKFVMGYYAISRGLDITIPILANVIPSFLTLLVVFPFLKTGSNEFAKKKISLKYKELILLFVTFFLLNMPFTLDLILVNPDIRPAYGALSLIGKIVFFASTMIAGVMVSKLANQQTKLRKKTLLISLGIAAFTGLGLSLIYFLFTDIIVQFVFNGMYNEITPYITLYAIGMSAYSISYLVINFLIINNFCRAHHIIVIFQQLIPLTCLIW